MTAERWQQVKELFETARLAPHSDRERVLLDSGDLDLAREVRVLLDAADQSADFLEEPALASHLQGVADPISAPFVGVRVGAYLATRQIGEGGMGVVYEGVRADGQFEQRVAIKILKGWMIGDVDIARFRAERQILADLDHPNIARLLDGGTTADGRPYYAMEFVEGQYVDEYCRSRNLRVNDRLELFRKVCDAVEYAHQHGVIHRDLKPANLLVTASGAPKLLDFGIAKVQDTGAATPRTATLHRVATPLYASPEQLQGEPITPASDIYSLGVLLYELLTGAHPYRTTSDAIHLVAAAVCEQEPEPPSGKAGQLAWGRDLDHVVLKAMRKVPADRYPTAAELSGEIGRYLEHRPVLARSGSLGRQAQRALRKAWRPAGIAVAAIVLSVLAAGVWTRFGTAPAKTPRRSLAVVGFQNLSGRGEASWIATALSEMLATDLASSERVRVVSAETVDRVKSDLSMPDSQQYVREELGRLRTNLDVDYFVTGSYLASPQGADSTLRLNVRLLDARSGQIVAGASETGRASELSSLVSDALGDLLRNPEWSDVARKRSPAALGLYANPTSAKLYAEGLERIRKFDTLGARDLFKQAVAADPKNPMAHSAYASSLRTLGYEDQARGEAKLAYDLSSTLPREERLSVAGRYYMSIGNWSQAIQTDRTLWDLFNDNPEYGLRLADAQISASKPNDAIATIQTLRATPSGKSIAPRIDLAEAHAAHLQADYTRELAAASRALEAAKSMNARAMAAESYKQVGDALYGLARNDEALAALKSAEAIHRELGDTFGIASVLLREGRLFWSKGDYSTNKEYVQKALELFEQIGNRSAVPTALNNLALATRGQGDLLGALKLFEQAIAIGRELGAKDSMSGALNNAGNVLRRLNRQEEARRYFEECLSIAVQLNNREQVARSHITIASIDFDEGNLLSASEHIQQALSMAANLNDLRLRAVFLQNLGDLKEAQGDLAGARQAYEESIAISRTLKARQYIADGAATVADLARQQKDFAAAARSLTEAKEYYIAQKQKNGIWDAQLTGARIRIAMGDAAGTEKEIEDSVAGFHSIKSAARETSAYTVLAESFLAQHQVPQARSAIQRGRDAYLATHEFLARMKYRLVSARVTAALGDHAQASQDLQTLRAELESKDWSLLASEARQALAEIHQ